MGYEKESSVHCYRELQMTYVSDVEAAFDLATRDGAEVLSTDTDGLTLRILSHKNAATMMTQI